MGSLPSSYRRRFAPNSQEHQVLSDEAAENDMYTAVALCNIPPDRNSEETIYIGERLNIISEEGDKLRVSTTSTGIESFVLRNCVSKVYNRWLFEGITRRNAEDLLMLPQNHTGSFLIRKSQTCPGSYSLSIRQNGGNRGNIKHYRILQLHNGWFCIHPHHPFSTLNQLVDYYSRTANGTLCRLTEPCLFSDMNTPPEAISSPIVIQRPNLNWREVTRSMIQRQPKRAQEESLVSEGLRETVNAYIYFTEESCCED
ncbi:src-like-adapter 2 [Triplophysa dalaica]|uniref:src-like-adapter 2 n=1 Tax=Triplophysa dalaica TaxID=1582913 RepID=UPI0024DF9980|nr:src-like-adapter 2 [Triplophysa dalaica]XP_056591153.1 src-like-adapter 2 [Triplophysa dalaica]